MKRNPFFDNAKFILIFLVVFGHLIEPFRSEQSYINTVYLWLYAFHMPVFIFLAGFYAKGSKNKTALIKLAKKLIVPYVIFQVLYTIFYFFLGKSGWLTDNIFYPHWSLWFLLSLFCWHILLIIYKKMNAAIGISLAILIGVLVGYFDQIGHAYSLSRTIVFFPYFLIGYWVTNKQILRLKKYSIKIAATLIFISTFIIVAFVPDFSVGWLFASKSYSELGFEVIGGLGRLGVYGLAVLLGGAVLALIPQKQLRFTHLGERTLYVYLLHGFFIQVFRQYGWFNANSILAFLGLFLLALAITLLLSSKSIITIWQPLIEGSLSRLQKFRHRLKRNQPFA